MVGGRKYQPQRIIFTEHPPRREKPFTLSKTNKGEKGRFLFRRATTTKNNRTGKNE